MFCQNEGLPSEIDVAGTGVTRFCRSVRRSVTQYFIAISAMVFAVVLCWGSSRMALSTWHDTIPTLGLSEAMRYLPPIIAGVLILLFSFEHLMRRLSTPVAPEASWN